MTIEAYLPIFPGYYNTLFEGALEDAENDAIEYNSEELGRNLSYDDFNFDYSGIMNFLNEKACEWVENSLKELGFNISVTFNKMVSPKSYNYTTDKLDATFNFGDDVIQNIANYLADHSDEFRSYVKENHSSRSGFISFLSNDADEWLEDLSETIEDDRMFTSILTFILENEDYDSEKMYYFATDTSDYMGYFEYEIVENNLNESKKLRKAIKLIEAVTGKKVSFKKEKIK